ncbi:hypothetical protein AIF0345_0803 [Actinomyces israelii]|nr:hypothetical protein AIF0345_0803 [Actinomyces israelii]
MTWCARAPGARGDLIEGPPPPAPGRCCAAGSSMTAPGARNPDPAGALAAACPPRPRVGCWVCLGLWLIVLVGRLCYCLPDRVRPRPASGTRAPSEDASDLCTGLDPGGSVVDGLASGGVHHWRGLCRSFRVAPADLRPGTRPAHPGPAHRRRSAVALQVPGGLGGGVPGCRGPGRGGRSSCPSSSGTCGPPYRSPRTPGAGAARCRPSGVPDHLPGAAARGRSSGRSSPPPRVLIQVDTAHPLHRGPAGGGSPAGPGRDASPGPGGPGAVAPGLSAGPRPGGPWERTGGCAPCRGPRAHAPAAAGPR